MDVFTELEARIAEISDLLSTADNVGSLPAAVSLLGDESVYQLMMLATQAGQMIERITLVTSGVFESRSRRENGHSGLAQARGYRNSVTLVQQLSGVSRRAAMMQVRVGEALLEDGCVDVSPAQRRGVGESPGKSTATSEPTEHQPWHAPLTRAVMQGKISSSQHDVLRRGLGEPPVMDTGQILASAQISDLENASNVTSGEDGEADEAGDWADSAPNPETVAAWRCAAERLIEEAAHVSVEELAKQARVIRDTLDPTGAQERFQKRYEARSFCMWTDQDGATHGKFLFDEASAAWLRNMIDSALRPRRGGPRFVNPDEAEAARQLHKDPRSNDQLAHDLVVDVLKAGAVADAERVFGSRQAGVRIVQVVDREQYLAGKVPHVTRFIDGGESIPSSAAEQQRCNSGTQVIIADRAGNPLDVGREQRLYTTKQRVARAVRDGGCRWKACDRPASYCEAHHIDHWEADSGRTDIDRGILLCRFHHMQLHNNGWKITRDALGPFMLHPPSQSTDLHPPEANMRDMYSPGGSSPDGTSTGGTLPDPAESAIELVPRLALTYGWEASSVGKRSQTTAA